MMIIVERFIVVYSLGTALKYVTSVKTGEYSRLLLSRAFNVIEFGYAGYCHCSVVYSRNAPKVDVCSADIFSLPCHVLLVPLYVGYYRKSNLQI
jgi:hypothetical protein